ncbi:MAG TPA: glutathione S-transferase family protein [Myxococcota bacterium]|nr:glutathione S-transferase family protein [Myxococcota bacterium]
MRRLYGSSVSRACRSLIALEELGLEYEHVPSLPGIRPGDRELVDGLNPNGRVPILDDAGLVLWESMAINLYLGDRYGGPLWPGAPAERAALYQWTLWGQTEMDRADFVEARRSGDAERIAAARAAKAKALGVLDRALAERPWLLGDAFTLADVNVAATLSQPNENGKVDWDQLDPFALGLTRLGDWLRRCTSRDSWKKVGALG